MKKEIQGLVSKFDGLTLEVEFVIPEEIVGIVQIAHGMAEHKERYEPFMEYLAEHGFLVAIHDHRGHGNSIKDRTELGYFYTENIEGIVEDLYQVTRLLKEKYPDIPICLFSHSMGTLVARNYIKKYDDEIDKLILCGPPTQNHAAGFALWMAKISKKVNGEKHRNQWIQKMAFGGYDKNGEINSWLSTDKGVVCLYNQDPCCGYVFTNNGFINLFQLMISAFSKDGWEKKNPDLPILLIAGQDDPVIQSKRKYKKLVKFLNERGYQNTTQRLYPNMRHEILNERKKKMVYRDILRFM